MTTFITIPSKILFFFILNPSISGCGQNNDFACRSEHFIQYLITNIFWNLTPYPTHIWWWFAGCFAVEIKTFHVIPSNNFMFGSCFPPHCLTLIHSICHKSQCSLEHHRTYNDQCHIGILLRLNFPQIWLSHVVGMAKCLSTAHLILLMGI